MIRLSCNSDRSQSEYITCMHYYNTTTCTCTCILTGCHVTLNSTDAYQEIVGL